MASTTVGGLPRELNDRSGVVRITGGRGMKPVCRQTAKTELREAGSKTNLPHVEIGITGELTWNRVIDTAVPAFPVRPWPAEPISKTMPVQ